jgi:hypothetical protein
MVSPVLNSPRTASRASADSAMWWAMRAASPCSLPSGSRAARLISAGTNSTMPSALKTRAWCVIPRSRIRVCTEPTAPDRARSAAPAARSRARARRRRAPVEAFASVRSPGPAAAMRRPPSSGAGVSSQIVSSGITGIPPRREFRRIPQPGGVAGPSAGPRSFGADDARAAAPAPRCCRTPPDLAARPTTGAAGNRGRI